MAVKGFVFRVSVVKKSDHTGVYRIAALECCYGQVYRPRSLAPICFQTRCGGLPSALRIISEILPRETNVAGGCVRE